MRLSWTLHRDGRTVADDEIVRPEERLAWPLTIGLGAQHVVAMFGATFLVPLLTGFPPTTTLFFSGVGTLLFLLVTANRLPSYLGSSFAFIAPIQAATATGTLGNALFGVLAVGLTLALVGVVVLVTGTRWIEALMPPVVTGAIVALIGLNLSGAATANVQLAPWTAMITLAAVIVVAVGLRGLAARLSVLLGVAVGYVVAALAGAVDLGPVRDAAWVGLPDFFAPEPSWSVLPAFLPVVLVLVAENVGHVRTVAHLTGDESLNRLTGRALLADGIATTLAGSAGGSGTTTYGENIGVMAATRVYSTAAYWVAGVVALVLSLSPKFGALVNTIPAGVLGGVTVALYGLIGVIGVKIWIDNRVDFSRPVNQLTAAVALVIGIGNLTLGGEDVLVTGIALGTVAALVVYHGATALERLRA
ncbi:MULTISPECIES: uracil-xanthine permease family protein [unclassified Nocardioides]|uniref:uracil-xanthine permease family protein n=1 Tax=unclassified Nocardioides TaxID=2615069 RepID=UPI00070364E3|nr:MULTISPECIES: solute carrier family 23 protein [unclassified Nocardioides]KQP65469.1 nitrate reductase [Nocardioides sp. Leaf285]KQQ42734.1 nitrate reductase [Nocardioides sp. Leaf307]